MCFISLNINAQSYRSAYGWTSAEVVHIVTDAQNNTYVAIGFSGTKDFDPGPGVTNLTASSDGSMALCKYDSLGVFVFAKKLPTRDRNADLEIDSQGNIYFSSDFYETVDLNPGSGSFTVSSFNNFQIPQSINADDVYVVKLNANGDFIWGKRFGTIYADGIQIDLSIDDELIIVLDYRGTLYLQTVPVTTYNSGSDYNMAIFSLDVNGEITWLHDVGGSNEDDSANHLEVTPNGEFLVTGTFSGTTDLDPGPGTASYTANSADAFIARYDMEGNFLNARIYGGPGVQFGNRCFERNGSLYASLIYDTQIDADAGAGVYAFEQDSVGRYIFLKDSLEFGLQWALELPFGDTEGFVNVMSQNQIHVDPLGNIYAGFDFTRTTQVAVNNQMTTLSPLGVIDGILCKVNATGSIAWFKRYGGEPDDINPEGYYYSTAAMALKGPNHLVFGGNMQGTCDFDQGIGDGFVTTITSGNNTYLATLELVPDPGDLDGDGEVTSIDIEILISNLGCVTCSELDLNGDNLVTVVDIMLYLDLIDG